ncbi:juvenile hormone acid O-methyltransferase-like [Amblyomma americanum]
MEAGSTSLKAEAYACFQEYPARENLNALQKAMFRDPPRPDEQHLEVGCGPGAFTKSHVQQHCSPCSRLVAVDKLPGMIEVARKTSQHPGIYYDVLDIEAGDAESFVKKYGRFSRVYSFLTFHYLKSQKAGYLNVRRLLEDDGECFVLSCLHAPPISAWLEVYLTPKWKPLIPDPREIYSDMFYFDCNKPLRELESEVRHLVAEAGLHCLDCEVYKNEWVFPDAETVVDFVSMSYDFEAHLPPEDYPEFKKAWTAALTNMRTVTATGCSLPFTFYAIRATRQSPTV